MDRREKYEYLMGIIDRWTEEKQTEPKESFKHLLEGALVRENVVTPGVCTSVARLKTYLSLDILQIYSTKSRITWKEISRALAGETKKKYMYNFQMLDQCFSPKENREAAKGLQLLAEDSELPESLEEWEDVPVYLLERLQEVFQKKLGEYWRMCDESPNGSTGGKKITGRSRGTASAAKDNGGRAKQEKYMECVRALALHEIFVRKFLETRNMMLEEAGKHYEMLGSMPDEMTEAVSRFGEADGIRRKELAEQLKFRIREEMENIKWHGKFLILQVVCLEHMISLGAEIQVIMLLEKKRLEEIHDSTKSVRGEVERYLEFMKDRYLTSIDNYNKNKNKYYRSLEKRVKDVFFCYVDSIPWCERQDVSKIIESYLGMVEQGRWNEEQRAELWKAQKIIAAPLLFINKEADPAS